MSGGEREADRTVRLATTDPLDAFEEGVQEGWRLALSWAGIEDARLTPPTEGRSDERGRHE